MLKAKYPICSFHFPIFIFHLTSPYHLSPHLPAIDTLSRIVFFFGVGVGGARRSGTGGPACDPTSFPLTQNARLQLMSNDSTEPSANSQITSPAGAAAPANSDTQKPE